MNAELRRAIVERDYPTVERELLNSSEETVSAIIRGNLASYFIGSMIETQSRIMAKAWLSALARFPEELAIATTNNAVYVLASDFRSDRDRFKHCYGPTFSEAVASALSPQTGLDAAGNGCDLVILKLTYRALFKLAPEAKLWIRDNFLSVDPLSPFMLGEGAFCYGDSKMLPILNYIGITPDVLQDRVREILDAQLAVNKGSTRMLGLAAGTEHFDNAYFLKVANLRLNPPVASGGLMKDTLNERRSLSRMFLVSVDFSDRETVLACIQALLLPEDTLDPEGLTTSQLLLSYVALEKNTTAGHILRKKIYERGFLTASEIGPYLLTPTHLKHAVEFSGVDKDELLNYVSDDLRVSRLEVDLGL